MSCEKYRDSLVSFLYDEIDEADRRQFETHLTDCESCRNEIESFRGVRGVLSSWPPPTEEAGLVFIEEKASGRSSLGSWWRNAGFWMKSALAAPAVALIILAVLNLEVSYNETGFHGKIGFWPSDSGRNTSTAAVTNEATGKTVPVGYGESARMQDEELLNQVRRLIEQSEARQKREFSVALTEATQMQAQDRSRNLAAFREEIGNRQLQSQREMLNVLQVMEQSMTPQPLPVSSGGGN